QAKRQQNGYPASLQLQLHLSDPTVEKFEEKPGMVNLAEPFKDKMGVPFRVPGTLILPRIVVCLSVNYAFVTKMCHQTHKTECKAPG
ncbi:LOW QUALITY PROTEIN: hypothetical protein U0070_020045, partial [Myodes glareolus]